jgi:hypothetical protein
VTGLSPLPKVCALLNRHGAKYVIVGAQAGILHGYIRTTEDVDILIPEEPANHRLVIAALAELEDHAAAELTPEDLVENVVVKVADEVEVDVSTRAWTISYKDARPSALRTTIEGIEVPFVSLPVLIASKDTYREQDRVDVQHLRALLARQEK